MRTPGALSTPRPSCTACRPCPGPARRHREAQPIRLAQYLVSGIDAATTPPDLTERILATYIEAAHDLANHVSAAVRLQRGEPLKDTDLNRI